MIVDGEVLQGLLEAAPDAIVAVDASGAIVFANHQTEDLFGWPRAELLGTRVEVLVPDRFASAHPALRDRYGEAPTTRPMGASSDLWARRRDGSEFPVEISLSSLPTQEGPVVAAAIRDVTERMELERTRQRLALEAQREQSHRLESIGQLAGGVAHDFNNLLGVILNCATLARRGTTDPQVAEDIDQIRSAAERAADLTRQLLAFARRDVARPEVLDVAEVIGRFAQLLERVLGERVRLVVDPVPAGLSVRADRHQIEQVLLNLCLNGRDAMPEGGALTISSRVEELGVDPPHGLRPGSYAVITVTDEGEGMAPEVVERAFEPFFTTKPKGDGTGLGLSTAYGIVQQHGGALRIRSQEGVGTAVEVYLVPERPTSAPEPAEEQVRPAGGETLLVVEDEEWLRAVVVRMLEAEGYAVVAAADALGALDRFDRMDPPPDLVLSDVVMPGRSGPELVAMLRARGMEVPVVFMTGYAPTEADVGGERVLAKPFTDVELYTAVREALDGR